MKKTVVITGFGCDLYPHGTVHRVIDKGAHEDVYWTESENDRFPKEWCLVIDGRRSTRRSASGFNHISLETTFGWETGRFSGGITLNHFRRLGINHDGSETGEFPREDYDEVYDYMRDKGLKFPKFESGKP